MTTKRSSGGRRSTARLSSCALGLFLAGCASQPADTAVMDNLEEMQIRVRLLQTELTALRQSLSERDEALAQRDTGQVTVQDQLAALQEQMDTLPESVAMLCPSPLPVPTVTQCDGSADAQRVMVSGDKLVVGEVERVWLDPPATFLEARIDASSEISALRAAEVVEFERDGNKWVRFNVQVEDEPVPVERRLRRYAKPPAGENGNRRPVVTLRVQLGDVRESVELTLSELPGVEESLVLGRNFLTDVALVDVARKHVQPAFQAPD
jgi:hypothetical protein